MIIDINDNLLLQMYQMEGTDDIQRFIVVRLNIKIRQCNKTNIFQRYY